MNQHMFFFRTAKSAKQVCWTTEIIVAMTTTSQPKVIPSVVILLVNTKMIETTDKMLWSPGG